MNFSIVMARFLAEVGRIREIPEYGAVAQDGHVGSAETGVLRPQAPAEDRLHTQDPEQLGSGELHRDLLRVAVAGEIEPLVGERRDALERRAPLAPGPEVEDRRVVLAHAFRADLPQHDDPLRLGEGQRAQQELVDHREDGRVRADPQRERRAGRPAGWLTFALRADSRR